MFAYRLPHTYSNTSLKGKPSGSGPHSFVIPWQSTVMEEIKPTCVLLTVPQSKDIFQLLKWSMAGRSPPTQLGAFSISMLVSDAVALEGAEEVCCGWKQRHRLRERQRSPKRGVSTLTNGYYTVMSCGSGLPFLLFTGYHLYIQLWPVSHLPITH